MVWNWPLINVHFVGETDQSATPKRDEELVVDLSGWDTVTALSVNRVNEKLAEGMAGLVSNFSFAGNMFGTPHCGSGMFGPWRLLPSDPGDLVRLALPIPTGSVSAGSDPPIDLAGLTAIVQVSLELLSRDQDRSRNLVFSFHAAGMFGDDPKPGLVTPVGLTGAAAVLAELGETGTGIVLNGIANSLVTNASTLSFVFAQLNVVPPGTNSWLAPVRSAYCYAHTGAPGHPGYLMILSVITGRSCSTLPRNVAPGLLAGGGDLVFALSSEQFLTHVVGAALASALGGQASQSHLTYDRGRGSLVNTTAFGIKQIKQGALWYTPQVRALSATVVGDFLNVSVSGDCDLHADILMTYWVTSQPRMVFDPATAFISFIADPHPTSGHEVDIPWWFYLGGPIVRDITELVVTIITNGIATELAGELGSDKLVGWVTTPVRWPGIREIAVTNAVLDGCLSITGSVN